MKKSIILLLTFLLIPLALAATYTPINYVSDYADIIPADQESQINALAKQIEQNTTVEIAILTIPSLDGQDINQLAVEIFEQWGIGKKDINNGLLILIAPADRQYRFEVGYGLEPVLTDAQAGRIGRSRFTENFQQGNYGQGIYAALQDIEATIQGEEYVISQQEQEQSFALGKGLLWLFLMVSVGIIGSTNKKKNKVKWPVRITTGLIFIVILGTISFILAAIFLFFFGFFLIPRKGGRGGMIYMGGFGGGGLGGGGFGGFGGGLSGGGGFGGRW